MQPTTMIAVISVTFIVTTAATAILLPLVRHLGAYLDVLTRQKQENIVQGGEALRRIETSLALVQEELAKAGEEREFLTQLYPQATRSLPKSSPGVGDGSS